MVTTKWTEKSARSVLSSVAVTNGDEIHSIVTKATSTGKKITYVVPAFRQKIHETQTPEAFIIKLCNSLGYMTAISYSGAQQVQ